MFLGRRLEALCSLTVSSPVWPSMIFFVLLFVPLFPFITSFSLAKWMKAKSFWTALKKFTQGICFCLFFFNSLVRSKQNFVLSIVHKPQFILSFCFCDIIYTNLQQLLYSFLVSSHVLWRSELTQSCCEARRLFLFKDHAVSSLSGLCAISWTKCTHRDLTNSHETSNTISS